MVDQTRDMNSVNSVRGKSRRQRIRAALTSFCAAMATVATVATGWALDGQEILQRVDRAFTPVSYEQYALIRSYRLGVQAPEKVIYVARQDTDQFIALVRGGNEGNRAILRRGNSVVTQDDQGGDVKQSNLMESSFGDGLLDNADILRVDYSSGYHGRLLREDKSAYWLELNAKSEHVIPVRIVLQVDRKNFLPVSEEHYAVDGRLVKQIEFKGVVFYGDGMARPSLVRVTSPLHKSYVSEIYIGDILPREFAQETFTEAFLPRADSLLFQ